MPILYAELQIAGRQVACDVASFSFSQATDEKGRPSSVVRVGFLHVTISGEAAGWPLWEEIKFNPYRRESGHVVFFQNEGITARRYTFYDAALVHLQFRYDGTGRAGKQAAVGVVLTFSAATIEVQGLRVENHSLIPWPTSPATSFRALTKPADPQPSAHLAAGLGLLVRKAVQAAPEAAPIALEGIARTITLLPGLLLAPMNGNADPAQDYDNLLAARNHQQQQAVPLPPKPDEMRLAELEHALAAQTLTAQQEAELVILLAKVKGIHGQQLSDLPGTKLPTGSDFMRHRQERKPLGERPQSKKTGFLGSPKLTKPQLTALAKTAQEQYGVSVQVLKPKEMTVFTRNPNVRAAFRTDLDPTGQRLGTIYVQKGVTAYELTHELMHAKQFHQLGYDKYWQNQTQLQREEFVLSELMRNKSQWSVAEIKHATRYINFIEYEKWTD